MHVGTFADQAPYGMMGMRQDSATGDFVDAFNGFFYEFILYPYHKNEFETFD